MKLLLHYYFTFVCLSFLLLFFFFEYTRTCYLSLASLHTTSLPAIMFSVIFFFYYHQFSTSRLSNFLFHLISNFIRSFLLYLLCRYSTPVYFNMLFWSSLYSSSLLFLLFYFSSLFYCLTFVDSPFSFYFPSS